MRQDSGLDPVPVQEPRSDASKDAIIATLKERVKRLEGENCDLLWWIWPIRAIPFPTLSGEG